MSKTGLFISSLLSGFFFFETQAQTDKSNLSFSERTGIKGITTYLHFNTFANDDLLGTKPYFNERISPVQKQELDNLIATYGESSNSNQSHQYRKGDLVGTLRSELILSPFKLSGKVWKRNIEWSHGLAFQSVAGSYEYYANKVIDSITDISYSRTYKYQLLNLDYLSNIYFNYPVSGNTMLYAGVGAGVGILLSGYFRSSEGHATTYTVYDKEVGSEISDSRIDPATEYNSEKFNTMLFAALGVKVHISCRINIHAEYGLLATQHYLQNNYILPDIRHGLNLGIRYKFNKPEVDEGDGKKDAERPFW